MCKLSTENENDAKIKEVLNKRLDKPCSLIRRLNIIKTAILPQIYKFDAIPIKIPEGFYSVN